jgi:serine/threonine protein kinase
MQAQDPLIGRDLDGYLIEELLGHGGMGRVYRALDTRLKRYAAIKILEAEPRDMPKYAQRFNREAQAIAKLKHPHIVSVYRFNEIDGIFYMAMEYIDGADLRWVLKDYAANVNFVDYKTIFSIIEQIGSALDFAHQHQVIHRDVKPSNIMISRKGAAILTDFGLALDIDVGSVGEIFGSPHYIAPEQAINSAKAVSQTDLYSLGIILYEMLTGTIPFDTGSALQIAMAHISDPLPNPHKANPDLHPAFVPVLETILAKEPRDRYKTGAELSQALKAAIREAEQSQHIPHNTSLVKPVERIARNKIPLPEPIPGNETKAPTRIADVKETKVLSPQRQKQRRSPLTLITILLLIIMGTVAFYLYQNQGAMANTLSGAELVNAIIEGRVETVETGGGLATLQIYGLSILIEREHPLYDLVQVGDIIYLEGHYRIENGAYHFDSITLAKQNGEVVETLTTEGGN